MEHSENTRAHGKRRMRAVVPGAKTITEQLCCAWRDGRERDRAT
jgi:hypothetical protein